MCDVIRCVNVRRCDEQRINYADCNCSFVSINWGVKFEEGEISLLKKIPSKLRISLTMKRSFNFCKIELQVLTKYTSSEMCSFTVYAVCICICMFCWELQLNFMYSQTIAILLMIFLGYSYYPAVNSTAQFIFWWWEIKTEFTGGNITKHRIHMMNGRMGVSI